MSYDFLLGMLFMLIIYRPIIHVWRWIRQILILRAAMRPFRNAETREQANARIGEWRND